VTYALYSYVRPTNGEKLWIMELEISEAPNLACTRSWVVGGEPSPEQALTIISANAQTGSMMA
jgi:hypothetical protein